MRRVASTAPAHGRRRPASAWPRHVLTVLASCVALGGFAPATHAQAVPGVAAQEARSWFLRMQQAARQSNFEGTLVTSLAGGMPSSSRVVHYAVGEQTYEALEALDGQPRRLLRHNDAVHTLWPQTRVAVVERRDAMAGLSALPQRLDPLALEHYDLRAEGVARVAGRQARVFLLHPRDSLRYPQRLWADEQTGLVLRADVLSSFALSPAARPPAGQLPLSQWAATGGLQAAGPQVLESTAFSSVQIGVPPRPEGVVKALADLQGWQVLRPAQRPATLEAEGWQMARSVPGFSLAACTQRGLASTAPADEVLQVLFTDGLAMVSLFIEPRAGGGERPSGSVQQGATATVAQRKGEFQVTAVGDVPPATLRQFVDALQRRNP